MKSEHTLPTLQTSKQRKNTPSSVFPSKNQNIPAHNDLARLNTAAPSGDGCIEPPCTALGARQVCRSMASLLFPSRSSETRLQTWQVDSFCALKCSGRLSSSQHFLPSCMVSWAIGWWHIVVFKKPAEKNEQLSWCCAWAAPWWMACNGNKYKIKHMRQYNLNYR